jgi:glyoxylase-like metal-dependent hydrolase (beta-lactamase superfamily II)
VARVRGEGHVVRLPLEQRLVRGAFGQPEASVEVTQGVTRLDLGIVNAYLLGEAGGPWILVDTGTPGNAERIRAAAQERIGAEARPEAIVLTHGAGF